MLCPLLFNCPPIDHFMKYTIVRFKGRWVKMSNQLSTPSQWITVVNKSLVRK